MQTLTDETAISIVKDMTQCCRDIQALLVLDQIQFEKNNMELLDESNQQKIIKLEQLNHLMEKMNRQYLSAPHSSLMHKIKHDIALQHPDKQAEFQAVMHEFQLEMAKCYSGVTKNIDTVYSSIKQFKDIWDKLLSQQARASDTYESIGKK
jgi:hypothetical protein